MESTEEKELATGTFGCTDCGAELTYQPGSQFLNCQYCGAKNEIPQIEGEVEEFDFHSFLDKKLSKEEVKVESFVKCGTCGAQSTLEPNITSASCPYCATPLVIEDAQSEEIIQPKSLLPFKLDKDAAIKEFKKWVSKLWFAPGELKKAILNFDHFKGVYIPYWTYDSETVTQYVGQRGEYYYVTETYTVTEDDQEVTKTREVKKTRWYPANGTVEKFFDDVLTVATDTLPEKYISELEPWDMENLVPYNKSYLSGFITEKYQIDLAKGFENAKEIMTPKIRESIKRDIGGDRQRIILMNTNYDDIRFKHLLLPVFVSAYNFKGKLYQFLVNGRTGEVQGKRPYSWIKIALASLAGLAIIALIVFAFLYFQKEGATIENVE